MTAASIAVLVTAVAALVGALVALSKRRPEMAQVLVTSAGAVVVMQRDLLAATESRMDVLEEQMNKQALTIDKLSMKLRETEAKAYSLQKRVVLLEEILEQNGIPIPPNGVH